MKLIVLAEKNLVSDHTSMAVRRYHTLSEDTIPLTEDSYWSLFIVYSHILDPGLVKTVTGDIGLFN